MPLKKGSSKEVIEANIAELIKAGQDPKQAAAIAYKEAGVTKDKLPSALATGTPGRLQVRDKNVFYAPQKIGSKRSITPEGFLICHDVPIARTGQQLYLGEELPVLDADQAGEVRVDRPDDEVFNPETLASFEGKPVTIEHPDEFVTPQNYKQYAVGFAQNVRRGDGIYDDLMMADLVINDPRAIEYINKELPEVSAGYEADYEQEEPGRGVQRNIRGNHIALVERGRAGPRCSIQDKEPTMKKGNWYDRMLKAVKAKDADAIKEEMENMDEEMSTEAEKEDNELDKQVLARVEKLEGMLSKMMEMMSNAKAEDTYDGDDEDDDEMGEVGTTDEGDLTEAETAEFQKEAVGKVLTGDTLKAIKSRAEILAPGIAIPMADSLKKSSVADKLMRNALTRAMTTDTGKAAVSTFLMGRQLSALKGEALMGVFNGAAELVRVRNNDAGSRATLSTKDWGKATTVSDINKANAEFWSKRQ